MPDLLWLLSALAPLALWVAVRADRRQRDLDARLSERVRRLESRMDEPAIGDEPPEPVTVPVASERHSRLADVAAFRND